MSIPGFPQKRRWPWIAGAGAIAVVVLIGLGVWIGTSLQSGAPTRPTEQSSPSATTDAPTDPSTPPPTAPPAAGGVDACLGGDARTIDMLVDARAAAPNTVDGAIGFGATYMRWLGQKPIVSEADIQIAEQFVENIDLRADAASWEQVAGTEFHASTVNGYFRVESMSEGHVDVSYLLRVVVDGAVDPTNVGFTTVSLDWGEGGWTVTGEPDGADSKTMRETGTAFAGGC